MVHTINGIETVPHICSSKHLNKTGHNHDHETFSIFCTRAQTGLALHTDVVGINDFIALLMCFTRVCVDSLVLQMASSQQVIDIAALQR